MKWSFYPNQKLNLSQNLVSALVVFLVALPLCIGIAAACGLSPDKGLIAGAIGGIVVGLFGGAPLQVSGPANGLIPIISELGSEHGLIILGAAVMLAGIIQAMAGFLRLGVFFRALCPSVIYGLMAGFGLVIFSSQLMISLDGVPSGTFSANVAAIPTEFMKIFTSTATLHALLVSVFTLSGIIIWNALIKQLNHRSDLGYSQALRKVPPYLIGILIGTTVHYAFSLSSHTIAIPETISQDLSEGVNSLYALLAKDASAIGTIFEFAVTIAILASVETMVSTASLDKISAAKTSSNYNRELIAQGLGNFLCGLFSAPPITGVMIRSTANVEAGATSNISTIMHGLLLMGALLMFGQALHFIPAAALAAILMHADLRLINVKAVKLLAAEEKRHVITFLATTVAVITFGVLYGVAVGLGLSAFWLLRRFVALEIKCLDSKVELTGVATFMDLPRLLRFLESLPANSNLQVCTKGLRYIDPSARDVIDSLKSKMQGVPINFELLPGSKMTNP
jgi:MFS superfamily sulfate permease-like transporter